MQKEKWWKEVWSDWCAKPWFYIFIAVVCAVVVTALIVACLLAYHHKDRWSAFSTVGTWAAVFMTVVIAALQLFLAQKNRDNLTLRYVASVHMKVARIADAFVRCLWRVQGISTKRLVKITDNVQADLDAINNDLVLLLDLQLDIGEKEYLHSDWDARVRVFNEELKPLREWLTVYSDQKRFLEENNPDNVIQFTFLAEELVECMAEINQHATYVELIRGLITRLRMQMKEAQEKGKLF